MYDYLRSSRGVKLSKENVTSTLWASVIYKDRTLMGFLSRKTGISFDTNKPLKSGDAGNTLAALEKYGSCSREVVKEGIYKKFPELKNSKVKISVEEFTGIVHLIEKEWNIHFSSAIAAMSNDEYPGEKNKSYKFPSAKISLKTRPDWEEKPVVYIDPNVDIDINDYFRQEPMAQDNTYVAPTYIEPVDFTKPVDNSSSTTTGGRTSNRPTTSGSSTNSTPNPVTSNIPKYEIEFEDRYIVQQDNTYVSPQYTGVYASQFKMAKAYANKTIKEGLKKKYGINFKFVDTLLAAMKTKEGYWSVVKDVVEPCFKKAKILKKDMQIKKRLPYSRNDFIHTVETILGNNKPVAIEYCSEMLSSGKAHGAIMSEECGMHLSVIVGHRVHHGVHQMLIQNSWGQSCSSYSKRWDCYEKQGAVWVDSSILSSSSYRLVWLSK